MKQRTRYVSLVALVASSLVAGWYVTTTDAARVTSCQAGPTFCFQPLVNQPLETLRSIEVPTLAVPIWLSGGGT